MSKYECHLGGFTHWVPNAGNPLQAAIETLRECLDQWNTYPNHPILAIDLETNRQYKVNLSTVFKCLYLSANYDETLPQPPFDPDCDIGRAAGLIVLEPVTV